MEKLQELKEKVLAGGQLTGEEADKLAQMPLDMLCEAADTIRKHYCGNQFDLCTIINARSGRCSEDCKFCAQSVHYRTEIETYDLLPEEEIMEAAERNASLGVMRFSLVTSGRTVSRKETEILAGYIEKIRRQTGIEVCASLGLLDRERFAILKEAGLSRVHNNLEASSHYFKQVCSTHSWEDKVESIHAAEAAGLVICSGGIIGMGEDMKDRIDLALALRSLGITSVPVNILSPIPGTPYENAERLSETEILRTIAIFRFLLPKAFIRLAGGRGSLSDKGRKCFSSGANAAITGDMLTTAGISVETDLEMIRELGFHTS